MKYIKIIIFLVFISTSSFIIYDYVQNLTENKPELDFIVENRPVVDRANFVNIHHRIAIQDIIELIENTTGISIFIITLENSMNFINTDLTKMLLQRWNKVNGLEGENSVVLAFYKHEPEVNLVHTKDLDYVLNEKFSKNLINSMKETFNTADNYMNVSLKEGRVYDERYKEIIGEGIKEGLNDLKNQLQSAVLTLSRAEYQLQKEDTNTTDPRLVKLLFDNTFMLALLIGATALVTGGFFYYNIINICPQCGNKLKSDVVIITYPGPDSPGVKEFKKSCLACGFSQKERQVFFKNKLWKR
ncbi:MAG: TPM domain-containing protein [Candidatus Muiribacteriota bacterium]